MWDETCSERRCVLCDTKHTWVFTLRGKFPKGFKADRKYSGEQDWEGWFYFAGFYQNKVGWSDDVPGYIVTSIFEQGKIVANVPTYNVLGTNIWRFLVPSKDGNSTEIEEHTLKFHQCEEGQFACQIRGECIPITHRCDAKLDCPYPDLSDELECNIVQLGTSYRKGSPPEIVGDGKVLVSLDVHVDNVISMQELDLEYSAKLVLKMLWKDPRLSFNNLRDEDNDNSIKGKLKEIWYPELIFLNTNTEELTVVDERSQLAVRKGGQPEENPLDELLENMVYSGSENTLIMSRTYALTFSCQFDLQMFPFDKQTCPITFSVPQHLEDSINIKLQNVSTSGRIDMVRYHFEGVSGHLEKPGKVVTVTLSFKRIFKFHMANTFFPTMCLLAIMELTLFIDKNHFEATIMVALTGMLCMYTLFQSVSSSLPQTSYLKMIDIWILSGLTIPCIIFVLLILIDTGNVDDIFTKQSNNKVREIGSMTGPVSKMARIKHFTKPAMIETYAKVVVPVLTLVCAIVYWTVAMLHYYY